MRIWNSKYALTDGIREQEAEDRGDGMVKVGLATFLFGEGREWHRTKESALREAEKMRTKKIASLQRQISKLEKMQFEKPIDSGSTR